MARIRDDWESLIILFAEVELPSDSASKARILQTYPSDFSNKEILNNVPHFAYPCAFKCDVITHFSFVLTNLNSKWTFGYCRHTPNSDTCLVLLSDLPWHSTFFKVLDHCAELSSRQSSVTLKHFLEALYTSELPQPGLQLSITYTGEDLKLREFISPCPDHLKLPCIPEDRNITEYFNAVSASNMIAIFASMLNERRIIITSDRLNRLSACVQAANALIYPMHWQHIFIPLLPDFLLDYLSAPMPFLVGVPKMTLDKVRQSELGDIVILNADTNQLITPFDDVSVLPSDVLHNLRKSLKQSSAALGDGLCRAFMRALVHLIGGYREALRVVPGEKISFDRDAFVTNVRGTSRQLFLEKMLELQIFQQFIEQRLDTFNRGERFIDHFEIELNLNENNSNSRFKTQYREWTSTMRKEGGAFLRAVNPKVKSALSRSRQAVRNLRAIIVPPNNSHYPVPNSNRPSSAPSSPKLPPKIKKSTSGTAISQTSRTVTYVRTPQTISTAANSQSRKVTGSTSSKSSFYTNGSQTLPLPNNGIAPAASSESSDIDESDFSTMPRVDMNITTELENIFRNKVNHKPLNNGDNSGNNFVPIPPPRTDKLTGLSRTVKPLPLLNENQSFKQNNSVANKCLIEFDSPPKDNSSDSQRMVSLGELLFDPLYESTYNPQPPTQFDMNQNGLPCYEANNNNVNKFLNNNNTCFNNNANNLAQQNRAINYGNNLVSSSLESKPFTTEQIISHFELMNTQRNQMAKQSGSVAPTVVQQPTPFQTHCWQKFD